MLIYLIKNLDVVKLLLDHGANPNVNNVRGDYPITYTFNHEIQKLLRDKINEKDNY